MLCADKMSSKAAASASGPRVASRSCSDPPVSRLRIAIDRVSRMSPVSRPSAMYITVRPERPITRKDRGLDRCRTPVPGQNRRVQVETSNGRHFQKPFWQDLAVCHDHDQIRRKLRDSVQFLGVAYLRRLEDRQTERGGQIFWGWRQQGLRATGWFVRLRHHPDQKCRRRVGKPSQCRQPNLATAHEYDARLILQALKAMTASCVLQMTPRMSWRTFTGGCSASICVTRPE